MSRITALGLVAVAGAAFAAPAPTQAQQEFQFSGTWIGTFEDRSEPERDMATQGNTGTAFGLSDGSGRDRMIAGDGRYQCDGEWTLEFAGQNENLRGRGEARQECKAARQGTWVVPPETMDLFDFSYKNKGEGKDKELTFRFEIRARPAPTGSTSGNATGSSLLDSSNELIRCEAKGAYKPKDDKFEGRYTCRQDVRRAQAGRRTMAINIRGEFELRRGDS